MLNMLITGYIIYCMFLQTARIFSTVYQSCSDRKQGFFEYILILFFVLASIGIISLVIGFIASMLF